MNLPDIENQRPTEAELARKFSEMIAIHNSVHEGIILNLFKDDWNLIKSIGDFGCKDGALLNIIQEKRSDIEIVGVDVFPELKDISKINIDNFVIQDLRIPFDLKQKFDLLICMEVGEHIDARYIKPFVENIKRHTGNHLLMSWSHVSKKTHPTLKDAADLVTSATYGNGVIEALEYINRREK